MSEIKLISFNKPKQFSREDVFEKVSPYAIYSYYLGFDPKMNIPMKSPFREDKNPSFALQEWEGTILFKDFSTSLSGDVIKFVMILFSCSFFDAIQQIDRDFGLNLTQPTSVVRNLVDYSRPIRKKEDNDTIKSDILYKKQFFTAVDKAYWGSFGVSLETCMSFNVSSVEEVVLIKEDTVIVQKYKSDEPIFVYEFSGGSAYKIYRPYAKEKRYRFMGRYTVSDIQGFEQLPLQRIPFVVITKSMKDVMLLKRFGIYAVAPQSEGTLMSNGQLDHLFTISDLPPLLFFDNDQAGMEGMIKFHKKHGLPYTYIPKTFEQKDLSDYYLHNGEEDSITLLKTIIPCHYLKKSQL